MLPNGKGFLNTASATEKKQPEMAMVKR